MDNKSDKQLKGWPLVGAIVGLIGGILGIFGGGYSLYEKLCPPTLEILGVRPAYVKGVDSYLLDGKKVEFPKRGISFIVHLKSQSRSVSINRLELTGRLALTMNEWVMYQEKGNLKEFSSEYEAKKPYYQVSLSGWLNDSKSGITFGPYQEGLLRFTFLEPTSAHRGRSTDTQYLGFKNPQQNPKLTMHYITAYDFFQRDRETGINIPKEIRDGKMKFYLLAGTQKHLISTKNILSLKIIREKDWNEKSILSLYHQEPISYKQSSW